MKSGGSSTKFCELGRRAIFHLNSNPNSNITQLATPSLHLRETKTQESDLYPSLEPQRSFPKAEEFSADFAEAGNSLLKSRPRLRLSDPRIPSLLSLVLFLSLQLALLFNHTLCEAALLSTSPLVTTQKRRTGCLPRRKSSRRRFFSAGLATT